MGPFVSQNAPDPENGTKSSGTWCNMTLIGLQDCFMDCGRCSEYAAAVAGRRAIRGWSFLVRSDDPALRRFLLQSSASQRAVHLYEFKADSIVQPLESAD